jgi:N-alpha-acetyltransferase 50
LLDHVLSVAREEKASKVYVHVSTENGNAVKFYEKRGFKLAETIDDYYRDLEKKAAHLLELQIVEVASEEPKIE